MTLTPDYISGFDAGIQAAWEVVNAMVQTLPVDPRTNAVFVMRETALDIGDNILALKKRTASPQGGR